MSDNHNVEAPVNGEIPDLDKPVWGAVAIGKILNRNGRQVHHLLSKGEIQCAKKKGGIWTATPRALLREFGGA
jgi:hypothetical protein